MANSLTHLSGLVFRVLVVQVPQALREALGESHRSDGGVRIEIRMRQGRMSYFLIIIIVRFFHLCAASEKYTLPISDKKA